MKDFRFGVRITGGMAVGDERRNRILKSVTDIEFHPDVTAGKRNLDDAIKIPYDRLAVAGIAFSSIPEVFRTVATSISGNKVLYRATDANGNVVPLSFFQSFKDGSGLMGSTRINGQFSQIRFHPISSGSCNAVSTVPYDPTAFFLAIALAQVNEKLDAIKKTQEEIIEFLRREKRSQQEADLNTLVDVFNAFKFNFGNELFGSSNHKLVLDVKNRADKNILFYKDEAFANLPKRKKISLNKETQRSGRKISESVRDCQYALYIYSFASLVEVLLLGNFDKGYLKKVQEKVESYSLQYREFYTECFNALESVSESTVEAGVLGGVSIFSGALGRIIEKTPVGDKTQIDEMLFGASEAAAEVKKEMESEPTGMLVSSKGNVVIPFVRSIEAISYLYNQPFELLVDSDALYLKPVGGLQNNEAG